MCGTISTPISLQDIRNANVENRGSITVYLSAWSDEKIIAQLTKFPDVVWEVSSKHTNRKYREKNVKISPVSKEDFVQSFKTCEDVVCNAGVETLKNFNSSSYSKIENWLNCQEVLQINYSDNAREVVCDLVDRYRHKKK